MHLQNTMKHPKPKTPNPKLSTSEALLSDVEHSEDAKHCLKNMHCTDVSAQVRIDLEVGQLPERHGLGFRV